VAEVITVNMWCIDCHHGWRTRTARLPKRCSACRSTFISARVEGLKGGDMWSDGESHEIWERRIIMAETRTVAQRQALPWLKGRWFPRACHLFRSVPRCCCSRRDGGPSSTLWPNPGVRLSLCSLHGSPGLSLFPNMAISTDSVRFPGQDG
jgi:hypothetical protein